MDDNEHTEYHGIKYHLPAGKYDVKIHGLTRKAETQNDVENHGFLFELTKTDEFVSKIDSSEVDFRALFA
jgi:hypothetical protein